MKKYSQKRRRAMYKGDCVRPMCLFSVYGWVCGICKEKIDPSVRYPDPECATIDHVVPLAHGGEHVWKNCQPSHLRCNEDKADSLVTED